MPDSGSKVRAVTTSGSTPTEPCNSDHCAWHCLTWVAKAQRTVDSYRYSKRWKIKSKMPEKPPPSKNVAPAATVVSSKSASSSICA